MDSVEFAAQRKDQLSKAEKVIRPAAVAALEKYGSKDWYAGLVKVVLGLWNDTFEAESPSGVPDVAEKAFEKQLIQTLKRTTEPADPPSAAQIDRLTAWIGTYAVNDATHQASRSNGNGQVEWVTMQDEKVRPSHRAVEGEVRRVGGTFEVGGVKLRYPGEPVGDPSVFMNCRCVLRSVGKKARMALQADGSEDFEERTDVVIVALPAANDPIQASSSEDIVHMTLVYLGDSKELTVDIEEIKSELAGWAANVDGPLVEGVSGTATLGADKASVVLIDAHALAQLRNGMVASEDSPDSVDRYEGSFIGPAASAIEQFPTWIPHVTLGYPETPAPADYAGTEVTFDRFALWVGNDRTEYPFGGEVKEPVTAAAATEIEEPPVVEEIDDPDEDGFVDDLVDIPFHGVAAPTGIPSGDGRMFGIGGADFRNLPFPLSYQHASSDGHSGSVRVGRIDNMWVDDEGMIQYSGVFPANGEYTQRIVQDIVDGLVTGVSVDVDKAVIDMEASTDMDDIDAYMNGTALTVFKEYRIAGLTAVAIPAFQEAYVALGPCDCPDAVAIEEDESEALTASAGIQTFAPGTHDGPGWLTNPEDTERLRRYWTKGKGAAKIRWGQPGDFNRCRSQLAKYIKNPDYLAGACANMHKVALGVWPGQEAALRASGATMAPAVTLVPDMDETITASGKVRANLPREWFQNPQLEHPTPLTVTEDGRVYGHIAQWGVCHIGIAGVCTTAPYSNTNYAHFMSGLLETDGGDVQVGQLTVSIGHAGHKVSAAAATAHYDNSDAMFADVAVGEDVHGIWFAGAMRGNVGDDTRREIRATGKISGDWREIGGNLELVGAVVVGVPGFPIPRVSLVASGTHQTALLASGIVSSDTPQTPVVVQLGIVDAAVGEVMARLDRQARVTRTRQEAANRVRPVRLDRVKRLGK